MAKKRKPEIFPDMELGVCRCELVSSGPVGKPDPYKMMGTGMSCVCEFTPKEAKKFKVRIDDMTLWPKPGIWDKVMNPLLKRWASLVGELPPVFVMKEDKTLEEISDANLINHFKTELERIGKGEKATDLLPDGVVQKFRKMGLFKRKQRSEFSAKALKTLREIHE